MRPKEAVNAFDVARLAVEMERSLVGAYVDKAYQPTREEVLLRMRQPGVGRIDLAIGVGTYIAITRVARDNPLSPPAFATHLRRHITNTRITGVRQLGFDRILVLSMAKGDTAYELVIEMFHDGNVVLVKDGTILHPLIHQSFADRVVRPGRPYERPPPRFDPRGVDAAALGQRIRGSDRDVVRALAVECNLGGQWAEELIARAGLAPSTPAASLDDDAIGRIHAALTEVLAAVEGEGTTAVAIGDVEGEEKALDCAPVPMMTWKGVETRSAPSLLEALDDIFAPPPAQRETAQAAKVNAAAEKLENRIRIIERSLNEFKQVELAGRAAGDAIYANFSELEHILQAVRTMHDEHGWPAVEAAIKGKTTPSGITVTKINPKNGTLVFELPTTQGGHAIAKMWISKSVPENADMHYEDGKKHRDKEGGARKALADARAQVQALREQGDRLETEIEHRITRVPTKRFWFDTFRWFVTSDGHLVVGGRDARTNEGLVKKHMDSNDRYVHADVHGAPSIVVKAEPDKPVTDRSLEEAGDFAVAYSRAWSSGVASGEAYWVTPSQVSQTPESGEFLARGAFIIRGKRTSMRTQIRAAIGKAEYQGHAKIMGGPPRAVEAGCDEYVVIEPGDMDANALAEKLAAHFGVPHEELQRVMPPGKVKVVQVIGMPEEVVR